MELFEKGEVISQLRKGDIGLMELVLGCWQRLSVWIREEEGDGRSMLWWLKIAWWLLMEERKVIRVLEKVRE